MKILEVASEAVPFAKTGGLGDVLGALPVELAKQQNEVVQFLPYYQSVKKYEYKLTKSEISGSLIIDKNSYSYELYFLKNKKVNHTLYFIDCPELYDRPDLYTDSETGKDFKDNDIRFLFFNLAVLDAVKKLNFKPEIAHLHDWQAALIPALLKYNLSHDTFYENIETVLTIHNLAYQGTFDAERFNILNLPENLFYAGQAFEFYGKVNFLKGAISLVDKITTVSKSYAEEIQTNEFGCGLDGVLKARKNDLSGILNGVDYTVWSPSRDKKIPFNYHHANLSKKRMNKVELLNEAGLPHREKHPLIGIISRMADQKGFDLIAEIADDIFDLDLQMIVLGTGEKKYHDLFQSLSEKYPDKCKAYLAFDEKLAHKIEAASDIFLMPSQFEPCGLNQMYSLKYGTVPLVRKVGGLADTVTDFNREKMSGTGFVFENYDSKELLETIERAVTQFTRQREWFKIMKQGMKVDLSWAKSAESYISLFKETIGALEYSG